MKRSGSGGCFIVDSSVVGYDGSWNVRDAECHVERKKKLARKRGQEPKKGIWTAVKDSAALVAAIIGLFGVVITGAINTYIANQNQVAQRKLEEFNTQRQRELEDEKAQEAALQTYLTDIGDLILDDSSPLPEATAGDDVSKLARAKTLTVLLGLDGRRKRILLQFLKEELINAPNSIVSLSGADLSYAQLSGVDKDHNRFFLEGTDLSEANLFAAKMRFAYLLNADLSRAELTRADLTQCIMDKVTLTKAALQEADLSGASLQDANLSYAALLDADLSSAVIIAKGAPLWFLKQGATNLTDANLSHAALQDADLSSAVLQNVNLANADLTDANLTDAYLSEANLTDAKGWTVEQLTAAKTLKGATMPNGQKYKDWIKDKEGSAEDGKNSGSS